MDIVNLIVSLISGLAGGNIAGAAMKEKNLGPLINSIAGLVGGGLGGYILKALGILAASSAMGTTPDATAPALDLSTLLGNIGGSGAGGAILTAIITALKDGVKK